MWLDLAKDGEDLKKKKKETHKKNSPTLSHMFLVLPKLQQAHRPSITQGIASVSSFIMLVVSSSQNALNIINDL